MTMEEIIMGEKRYRKKGMGSTSCQMSLVSLVVKDRTRKNGKLLAYIKGESRRRHFGTAGWRGPSRKS